MSSRPRCTRARGSLTFRGVAVSLAALCAAAIASSPAPAAALSSAGALTLEGAARPAAATGPATADARSDAETVTLPAAAFAHGRAVAVRAAPRPGARLIAKLPQLRYDYRPTVFELIGRRRERSGELWMRLHVPGRPNGQKGWARATDFDVRDSVAATRIVIDRSRRRLRLIADGRTVVRAPVAVGTRAAPTPLGSFYVTAAFRPSDPFLGSWAFETSAYAAITDWPRGGVVGLHGTSRPASVGRRASHGCLRVYNRVIQRLRRTVRLGTPIVIRA